MDPMGLDAAVSHPSPSQGEMDFCLTPWSRRYDWDFTCGPHETFHVVCPGDLRVSMDSPLKTVGFFFPENSRIDLWTC